MKVIRAVVVSATLSTGLMMAVSSFAETAAEVTAKVESYKSSIESKKEALDTVENRLLAYVAKREDATAQLQDAREDYAEAKLKLEEANSLPAEEGARARDLAQRRIELGERGVQSRERRLERVEEKYQELLSEQKKLEADIKWLTSQIGPLSQQAATLKQQELRAAELKKAQPKPTPAPTPIVKATPPPVATPEPEPVETVEAESENPDTTVSTADITPEPQTGERAQPVNEDDLSPRQRYARTEMRKLNEKTKGADKSEHRRYSELVLEIDRDDLIELEYLGNDQFFSEITLSEGKHTLTINLRKFVVKIPKSADGDTFVVIYDTTDLSNARFVFFNKKLLD